MPGDTPRSHKLIADQEATIQTLATTRNLPPQLITLPLRKTAAVVHHDSGNVARTICSHPLPGAG